jgi:hypothetical protein
MWHYGGATAASESKWSEPSGDVYLVDRASMREIEAYESEQEKFFTCVSEANENVLRLTSGPVAGRFDHVARTSRKKNAGKHRRPLAAKPTLGKLDSCIDGRTAEGRECLRLALVCEEAQELVGDRCVSACSAGQSRIDSGECVAD